MDNCDHSWHYIGSKRQRAWQCSHCGNLRLDDPAQTRKWQGLTDEEVSEILDDVIGFNSCWGPETAFARAIEAKLKEKNNG